MAIYIYICEKCKKQYQAIVEMKNSEKLVKCPKCGNLMRRSVTSCNFKLK